MLSEKQQRMVALFEQHVGAEMAGDLDTTMATMSDDPHLNHVPTMAGGGGRDGVRAFYRDHLVGKFFPPDVKMQSVSRTVGEDRVVEELFISFTHTTVIDWLLPGVKPTGKKVEMAVAVVVGFADDKISQRSRYPTNKTATPSINSSKKTVPRLNSEAPLIAVLAAITPYVIGIDQLTGWSHRGRDETGKFTPLTSIVRKRNMFATIIAVLMKSPMLLIKRPKLIIITLVRTIVIPRARKSA